MTRTTTTRRRFPAALMLTTLLLIVPVGTTTAAARAGDHEVPPTICPIAWRKGTWHVRQLIRCAERRWPVPGGPSVALYVADRESNFEHDAYNAFSGASGVYQHLVRYWPGRAGAYGFRGWSAFNARANIIVTIRMVHRLGSWSPWGL
jgi:hypothetical protein